MSNKITETIHLREIRSRSAWEGLKGEEGRMKTMYLYFKFKMSKYIVK